MKILIAFFAFFALLNAEVVTKTTTKTAVGTGYGSTYDEALNKALLDALGRMNGVRLSSSALSISKSTQSGTKHELEKLYAEKISKATNGRFDSYDVTNQIKTSDGYKVSVKIKKSSTSKFYKTPGLNPHNRRAIAVVNGYTKDLFFDVLGENKSSRTIANDITHRIITAITQTRKFTVLDREATEAYEDEANVILSSGAKDERLKLNSVLGADYLLVFAVDKFSLTPAKSSNLTAHKRNKFELNANIHYRVIAMATRQIKFSNDLDIRGVKLSGNDIYDEATRAIAQNITDEMIADIYPLKISQVNGDEIVVAQHLNEGDIYEIYSLGARIVDDYTHESVGRAESKTGEAKVIRVNPKISYLKLISGSAKKGDICRLSGSNLSSNAGNDDSHGKTTTEVKQLDTGGVVLPF